MAWQVIGNATVTPNSFEVIVGPIEVPANGGFEVRYRLTSGPRPFKFGYCLLSYRSSLGLELGTVRIHPTETYQDVLLGAGMEATDTSGVLVIQPRTWNLRWIKAGFSLSIELQADLPSDVPAGRFQAAAFTDTSVSLPLTQVGGLGQITFP